MIIRKAFYWWLFPAAVILPVWLLIGWAVFGSGGWTLLGLLILCPVIFLSQLAVAGIIVARRSVRESRAVSWYDVAFLTAWHAAIVAFGCFVPGATSFYAVMGIILALVAFWVSLGELVAETRTRVRRTFEAYERVAAGTPHAGGPNGGYAPDAEIFVVEEHRDTR